jgi:nicotinamide riboside transporter PnuC
MHRLHARPSIEGTVGAGIVGFTAFDLIVTAWTISSFFNKSFRESLIWATGMLVLGAVAFVFSLRRWAVWADHHSH